MNKKELKNRMVVKLRSGDKGIIVDDYIMFGKTHLQLSQYKENLECLREDCSCFDIVKVYDCTCTLDFLFYNINDLKTIWERF